MYVEEYPCLNDDIVLQCASATINNLLQTLVYFIEILHACGFDILS